MPDLHNDVDKRRGCNGSSYVRPCKHAIEAKNAVTWIEIAGGRTLAVAQWWLPVMHALVAHIEKFPPSTDSIVEFRCKNLPKLLLEMTGGCEYCAPHMERHSSRFF